MGEASFHKPTEVELAFLRIVTRDYPKLEAQVDSCEISDYDIVGYYTLRIVDREAVEPFLAMPVDGPEIHYESRRPPETVPMSAFPPNDPGLYLVQTLLWTDSDGYLASVEVVSYGDGYIADPCSAFIEAANAVPPLLKFASQRP